MRGTPQPTCTQCGPSTTFGAVSYPYAISKFELTNQQYVDFLYAVAASDPNELYNFEMGLEEPPFPFHGGIVQEGTAGSFTYRVVPGRANKPVNYVGWYDALRFANWLHNGRPTGPQGSATTEDVAYTITFAGILANSIVRNPGAQYFVPTENEWYKAAYYRAATATYFDYPTSSDSISTCDAPTSLSNRANCDGPGSNPADADVDDLTDVGSFTGSLSPYLTADQAGNLWEWTEQIGSTASTRFVRGESFAFMNTSTAASVRDVCATNCEVVNYGIRIAAAVPEPDLPLLVAVGALGLAFAIRGSVPLTFAAERAVGRADPG